MNDDFIYNPCDQCNYIGDEEWCYEHCIMARALMKLELMKVSNRNKDLMDLIKKEKENGN